jgi:hypothetical protein
MRREGNICSQWLPSVPECELGASRIRSASADTSSFIYTFSSHSGYTEGMLKVLSIGGNIFVWKIENIVRFICTNISGTQTVNVLNA